METQKEVFKVRHACDSHVIFSALVPGRLGVASTSTADQHQQEHHQSQLPEGGQGQRLSWLLPLPIILFI